MLILFCSFGDCVLLFEFFLFLIKVKEGKVFDSVSQSMSSLTTKVCQAVITPRVIGTNVKRIAQPLM